MVNGGCDLDSEPLGELSVLYAELRYRLFDPDFLKQFRETIPLNNITPESITDISQLLTSPKRKKEKRGEKRG